MTHHGHFMESGLTIEDDDVIINQVTFHLWTVHVCITVHIHIETFYTIVCSCVSTRRQVILSPPLTVVIVLGPYSRTAGVGPKVWDESAGQSSPQCLG